jgi:hypothetical protein
VKVKDTIKLALPGYHFIPSSNFSLSTDNQCLFCFSDKFLSDHYLIGPEFYAIPSEVKSIPVLTLYPCQINEGTTIGHFFPKSTFQALELNTMQEAAPLPPEKDIVPLRRNKMTVEEFQKIDIAKDLTPDQYSKFKALIMVYIDVFYFIPEDQGKNRLRSFYFKTRR